jgi:hypothetical protein
MVVPNYIPDPIEIPDNVTEQPFLVRLAFIRKVLSLHLLSVLFTSALALIVPPAVRLGPWLLALLGFLVLLSILRIALRGSRAEVAFSSFLLAPFLCLLAMVARSAESRGVPVWAVLPGVGCGYLYALLCGRDFSFVGQMVLAWIGSSVIIAVISIANSHEGAYALAAQAINAAYLAFYVYDSASLLSRRRLDEAFAAVVDLYRDVLNLFGYVPRVIQHWQKHRIWQLR